MATRSMIVYINDDDTVDASYIHNDGYPEGPHGVGFKLKTQFTTPLVARSVAGRGDRSELESPYIYDDGYMRRGVSYEDIVQEAEDMWCEYLYFYKEGHWFMQDLTSDQPSLKNW